MASADSEPIDMGKGLTFTVVGPMLGGGEKPSSASTRSGWTTTRTRCARSAEGLASYDDDSVPNLSSIVVLAESGERERKTMLFTGDARGDKILQGLELVGLVEPGGSLHVDVLKCPHHGSIANVEQDFFERVTADHYVFSGNGEHGNPDRETLELLVAARGRRRLHDPPHLSVDEIDVERKKHWESHQDEPWSDATHSLAAFLADNDKVVIVEEGVPHTIDLLGER